MRRAPHRPRAAAVGAAVVPAALPRRRRRGARDELAGEVAALPGGPGARGARALPRRLDRRPDGAGGALRRDVRPAPPGDASHLTYYAHGDTRERGMALLRLKKLYRAAGLPLESRRAARPPDGDARVRRARAARARRGAAGRAPRRRSSCCGSRCTTSAARTRTCSTRSRRCLPPLSVTERAEVARLAREGPPDEAVGLEPYGPPEAMPTGARA